MVMKILIEVMMMMFRPVPGGRGAWGDDNVKVMMMMMMMM